MTRAHRRRCRRSPSNKQYTIPDSPSSKADTPFSPSATATSQPFGEFSSITETQADTIELDDGLSCEKLIVYEALVVISLFPDDKRIRDYSPSA